MFPCIRRKNKDDDPDLPDDPDEEIPELLEEVQSCMSLKKSESICSAAEADLGSTSDSLEGNSDMLEAEENEEKGAAGKGRDGEKVNNSFGSQDSDADPCPVETGPGLRVQEVQGRTSDEKCCHREFDLSELNSSPTMEALHRLCKTFSGCTQEEKWDMAKAISTDHLGLMIDHYLESEETACDQLMCGVFSEGSCNLSACLSIFIMKLSESEILNGDELPLAKVKAIRGIRTIVADLSNTQTLKDKLLFHFVALANFLFSQFQLKEQGTRRKLKTYLVPGEAIDIFGILLQRLNLVHDMKAYFLPT